MISLLLTLMTFQPAPTDPIGAAAQSFASCVTTKVVAVPATLAAEAAADSVLKQCEQHRLALKEIVDRQNAGAAPEAEARSLETFDRTMTFIRARLVKLVGDLRQDKPR